MTTVEVHPVSVSSSGLGKMEDRKRPAAYDNEESAPPNKRQVTSSVNGGARNHQDADMPGRDELEKFQKEAIIRQMQEYKREKAAIESRLNDLSRRCAHHDDHVRAVNGWFSQLVDEVKLLAGDLKDGAQYSPFPTQLLASSSEEFRLQLESRRGDIFTILQRIARDESAAKPEVVELHEKIARLMANEKSYINQVEKLRLEKDQMEERLETASMRYMMAEKKLDRAKSMTVAKLERQAMAGGRSEAGSGLGGGADGSKSDSVNGQVDSESLAEAERARVAALAASAKHLEHVEQLAAENEKLTAELTSTKLKASTHADDDYAHTDLFKQLKAQYEEAIRKINHLESNNVDLRHENSRYRTEKSAFKMQLEAESQAAISEKELVLSRAENDLARIRTARDELHADLAIRKSAMETDRTSMTQIRDLLQARDDRIKALESEIERLDGVDAAVDGAANTDGLSVEELKAKHSNLERQYSMLNQELSSMSAAYKKISATTSIKVANLNELEEKVLRLSAEKAKADQKYFAAMKSKEIKDNEIRALRAQNSKSSDIVSQLKEVEQTARNMCVKLDKQVAELNDDLVALQGKYRESQSQLDQRKVGTDGLQKQIVELKAFLDSKDSARATAATAQRKAEIQVEELKVDIEDKNKRLETWKAKGLGSENEHYEVLRNLAICTVCRRNFKNTALKTCGHVFCLECVEDRLQSRMRKCPNCNKAFGATDHLRITL